MVINPDLAHHPAEVFKGPLVAGQKVLQRFGQRELQIHFAAERQNHEEEGQSPPGGAHRHRARATPVHLGTLAGFKMQRQERRARPGAHLPHKGPEDRVAAGEAAGLDPLKNLLGGVVVLGQQAQDLALVGIELAGALGLRGPLEALPAGPLAHGVYTQFERAGNLPQAQLLDGEEVPNLAIGLIIDHG